MENQAVKAPLVLIVESDPVHLTGIAAILEQNGFRAYLARTQEIAFEASQSLQFDLILFSFQADPLRAAEDASKLRVAPHMRQIPVVFLADGFESNWIEPLHLAGGVYCLPQVPDPALLISHLEKGLCLPHLAAAKIAPTKPHFSNDWVRLEN